MAVELTAVRNELIAQSRRRAQQASAMMTDDLKRTAPIDTGQLRRTTGVEVTSATDREIRATALIDVEYAEFVTMGTRPHVIRPRKPGGVLRFQVGGQTVYAAKVNHPGTSANPFFDEVVSRWGEYLNRAG